eukprot:SAG31_NODE_124_length_23684_cov_7.200127_1_plen_212_part_00
MTCRHSTQIGYSFFVSNALPHSRPLLTIDQVLIKLFHSLSLDGWPPSVRRQTEKQRILWAYKILFLDVLFPVELDRIIFLDADLTLNADIRELWEMDLHGAPYGYTPFCTRESGWHNEATLGYRFWESGYWKETLGDRRQYHISALFVVDLARLRSNGGADKLRATYNALSADPNSLANLDQDLPNYVQMQDGMLRIHSLPQAWLWCESWW